MKARNLLRNLLIVGVAGGILLVISRLAATSISIDVPTSLPCASSVPVTVSWQGNLVSGSLVTTLDGAPFNLGPPTPNGATGSTSITVGSHTIKATAILSSKILAFISASKTTSKSFTVPGNLVLPAAQSVDRLKTATINLSLSCPVLSPVSGATTSSDSRTASVPAQFTIPNNQPLPLLVSAPDLYGQATITATAPNWGPASTTVNVITALGVFSAVTPSTKGTSHSPDNKYQVTISGTANPYNAQFSTMTGTKVGSSSAFNTGTLYGTSTTLGGAGFCAQSAEGVVLSYNNHVPPPEDYTYSFLDLVSTSVPLAYYSVPVWSRQNPQRISPSQTPVALAPQVYLSQDCGLAMVVGVNPLYDTTGAPPYLPKYDVILYDLIRKRAISNGELPFNGTTVAASVITTTTPTNGYAVEVTVDNQILGKVPLN